MVRKLLLEVALCTASHASLAQGFWAPGACWVYSNGLANGARHTYIGDSIVNGLTLQVCTYETCWIDDFGVYHCPVMNGPFLEYVTMQGEALLYGLNSPIGLDTLFWLGVPGDRWWAPGSETNCLGFVGMIEIQDTGHVVNDGIQLRTWTAARLQEDGTPIPWTMKTITERIGVTPRTFCPTLCSAWTDCETFSLQVLEHYSDADISIPDGTSCDVTTGMPGATTPCSVLLPNPGTNQLTFAGLQPTAAVSVCDALGRTMHAASKLPTATIDTATWPSGTYFVMVTGNASAPSVLRWVKQ